jgi:hypothetical protein
MEEKHRIDSWFIGFAPVESPKIAWAVIAECGGYGAQASAPIAGNPLAPAKRLGLFGKEWARSKPTPTHENAQHSGELLMRSMRPLREISGV